MLIIKLIPFAGDIRTGSDKLCDLQDLPTKLAHTILQKYNKNDLHMLEVAYLCTALMTLLWCGIFFLQVKVMAC